MSAAGRMKKFWLKEFLLIHACGESRWKHGAVIRITALKGKTYFQLKKGAACIRHGCIKVLIWCAAIILWTDFARGKSKAKEAHCTWKSPARGMYWFLFGQKRFQWVASFVENGRLVQATRTKADRLLEFARQTKARLTNLIETRQLAWGVSKHHLGVLLSFQSSETLKQYLDHYSSQEGPLF